MNITIHTHQGQKIAEITSNEWVIRSIEDATAVLGEIYYSDTDRLIMHERNITPDFFELKNKMAGEILQKFSNYRMKLVVVGDFSKYESHSLRDFIYESNQGNQVNFLKSLEEALTVLGKS